MDETAGACSLWRMVSFSGLPTESGDYLVLEGVDLIPQVLHYYESGETFFLEPGREKRGIKGLLANILKDRVIIIQPGFYQGSYNGIPIAVDDVEFWADIHLPRIDIKLMPVEEADADNLEEEFFEEE